MRKLIAGPSVGIFRDECQIYVTTLFGEEIKEVVPGTVNVVRRRRRMKFASPRRLRCRMREKCWRWRSITTTSVCVNGRYQQWRRVRQKQIFPLIGPTGSVKRWRNAGALADAVLPAYGCDFTLTEAGYVGEDVENIIQKLLQHARHRAKAQRDFHIEKTDKYRKSDNPSTIRYFPRRRTAGAAETGRRQRRRRGSTAGRSQTSAAGILQVDTSKILFICGAFAGLDKVRSLTVLENRLRHCLGATVKAKSDKASEGGSRCRGRNR